MRTSSGTRAMTSDVFPDSFTIAHYGTCRLSDPVNCTIRFNREKDIILVEI